MKRYLLIVPVALAASWMASAQQKTTSIPILNAGFEADVLTCAPGANCYNSALPAWLPAWLPGGAGLCCGSAGTFKPSTVQYPDGIPGGVNVAFLGDSEKDGVIFQTVAATIQANTIYTLTLSVGQRADTPSTGYRASLVAGGATLAYDSSLSPAPGTWLKDVIVYNSGAHPPLLGQLLGISIRSLGTGQVNIDDVSLTATTQ